MRIMGDLIGKRFYVGESTGLFKRAMMLLMKMLNSNISMGVFYRPEAWN